MYGVEVCSFTLREHLETENTLEWDIEKHIETKREEVTGGWENYIMISFIMCTVHQMLSE
jgi:hypothetical protein